MRLNAAIEVWDFLIMPAARGTGRRRSFTRTFFVRLGGAVRIFARALWLK
jgi:hypothetical protein